MPFLKNVAGEYLNHYGAAELQEFLFVFPGHRSARFFLEYLGDELGDESMPAPRVVTIAELAEELSGRIVDNRIDLLFTLYRAYLNVLADMRAKHPEAKLRERSFDEFRSLGETMLSDFNEVDTHRVDPEQLFSNLADLHEISTDYLTPDQKEVIDEYFCTIHHRTELRQFWQHFDGKISGNKRKFLTLWEFLHPIYVEFNRLLEARGLTYTGGSYRLALQRVRDCGLDAIEESHIVFVGFNVLTSAEWHLFKEMRNYADFVWDISDLMVEHHTHLSASQYILRAVKKFPKPEWLNLEPSHTAGLPQKVKVIASPSNAVQAKIIGRELEEIYRHEDQCKAAQNCCEKDKTTGTKEENKASSASGADRVAVVLPDEGLLFPLINSLPDNIGSVNLSMGCSMRISPVSSFMAILRRLQVRGRYDRRLADDSFFHQDVKTLLAHPMTHIFLGTAAVTHARQMLVKGHRFMVSPRMIGLDTPAGRVLLRLVPKHFSPLQVIDYMRDVLSQIAELWRTDRDAPTSAEIEPEAPMHEAGSPECADEDDTIPADQPLSMDALGLAHLHVYIKDLDQLYEAFKQHGFNADPKTVFLLSDRLIAGETISFRGNPMGSLQLLGLLETRCLDFRQVIIPSMNERIFPRKMRSRTLIPDALRRGYGMPTIAAQESLFSYYFYRLISRAENVVLIYDSRTEGVKSGEPSRYIMQLEHIYRPNEFEKINYRFEPSITNNDLISIHKDEDICQRLNRYTDPDPGKRLSMSASMLKKYLQCPLMFYYEYFLNMSDQGEPEDHMSAIEMGNIVHSVLKQIYELHPNQEHEWYPLNPSRPNPHGDIARLVHRAIAKEYLHEKENLDIPLPVDAQLTAELLVDKIEKMIQLDSTMGLWNIDGLEAEMWREFALADGRSVTFKMVMDRVDRIQEPDGGVTIRIVDYKTGAEHVAAKEFDDIFSGDTSTANMIQLLLYAELLSQHEAYRHRAFRYQPVVMSMNKCDYIRPSIHKSLKPTEADYVSNYLTHVYTDAEKEQHSLRDMFVDRLRQVIADLLDPSRPFRQTDDPRHCQYCAHRSICRR